MSDDARPPVEHCDVAVLGGGVAGLLAATQLPDRHVVLLEAADRVGGRVASVRRGDYWVNVGAQFAAGEGPLAAVVDRLQLASGSLAGARAGMAVGGRILPSDRPARLVLRAPLSLRGRRDLAKLGLRMRRAYQRLTDNRDPADARAFRELLDGESAERFAAGIKDPEIRALFDAFMRSWMGAEASEVSAGHTALFMGASFVNASEIPNFSLPVGGNQAITDAIAAELGSRIRLGATVASVASYDDGVEITYEQDGVPRRLTAERCVVALPANEALRVVSDLPEPYRRALAAVRYGMFLVAGFFTGETGPQPWDDMYAIMVPGRAFNIIFNPAAGMRRSGPRAPGGALVAYAGGDAARRLDELSDDAIIDRYTRDLHAVLPETRRIVEEVVIRRWPRATPYWAPGERTSVRLLREPLGRVVLAGDYLGYPSMTSAAMAGEAAGRATLQGLEG